MTSVNGRKLVYELPDDWATEPVAIIARVFGYQSDDILKIFRAIKNPLQKEKISERGPLQGATRRDLNSISPVEAHDQNENPPSKEELQ